MSFEIKPATRTGVKPLIGLYAESGCGKTYSALLLARGIAGPQGKIVMGDTESGRGSLYADVLPGGYDVMDISEPFTPARMIEAMQAIEQSGAAIGILDSGSHEWEGLGGVLSMAAENETRSGKQGLHNWRMPKMEHARFMLKLLQSPIPWIICLRAKYKTRQTKVNGKTEIVKDDATSPIQADDFIFEMIAHAEILQNHSIILTKCSHPSLKGCFPADKTTPITIAHGEAIARWCSAPGASQPAIAGESLSALKKKLWQATKAIHGDNKETLQQWLIDEMLMAPEDTLETIPASQLMAIITNAQKKLQKP